MTLRTLVENTPDQVGSGFTAHFRANDLSEHVRQYLNLLGNKTQSITVVESPTKTKSITLRFVETVDCGTETALNKLISLLSSITLEYTRYDQQGDDAKRYTYPLWPFELYERRWTSDLSGTPFIWEIELRCKE